MITAALVIAAIWLPVALGAAWFLGRAIRIAGAEQTAQQRPVLRLVS